MKINPRQMDKIMKQMGMQMATIDAEEVIIKTTDKDIVITDPEVSKINVMGRDTFQISGSIEERPKERFSDEDVDTVVEQTGVSEEEARKTLEEVGDLAETILKLKKENQ
jgi:nascent polypeptide-associated complex subunit alpha